MTPESREEMRAKRITEQIAIEKIAEEKFPPTGRALLAFDRDGTLVPYADHPDDAIFEDGMRNILIKLAKNIDLTVAIVSARSIASLEKDFSPQDGLILAGNYGLEILFPDGRKHVEPAAIKAREEISKIKMELIPLEGKPIDAILDDHGLSLCLHWHRVPESKMKIIEDRISALEKKLSLVSLKKYPTSFEFFPQMEWSKAAGLERIAESLKDTEKAFYMFVGDTESDECGFKWVNDRKGLSVRVTKEFVETAAQFSFERPEQVGQLLSRINQIRA